MFHGLPKFASYPSLKGELDAYLDKACMFMHEVGFPFSWYNLWMGVKGPHNNE